MTNIVSVISSGFDEGYFATGKLSKSGCGLSMEQVPTCKIVIDIDKLDARFAEGQRRCDYMFVATSSEGINWVVPIEMKSGRVSADLAIEQLQTGASVIEEVITTSNVQFKFRPIIAMNGISKHDRNALKHKRNKINLCGKSEFVLLIKCGDSLAKILR